MNINISHINATSLVDGPGSRTVLFVQGCTIRCPGCQNVHLQDPVGGKLVDTDDLAQILAALAEKKNGITISGGEPFLQPKSLAALVMALRSHQVKNIIVYTGFQYEMLRSGLAGSYLWNMEVLDRIDTLVDGPFIASQDDDLITWRGSRNQRPIDTRASREAGRVICHNWELPEIVIGKNGEMIFPAGLVPALRSAGTVQPTRMCGQTK